MKLFCILAFNLLVQSLFSQERVLIDGLFSDWDDKPATYTDAINDNGTSNIDFSIFKAFNDEDYFFFYIELNTEINLQSDDNVTIYLDTDVNVNTGYNILGIGAELLYDLGDREGNVYLGGNTYPIGHDDIAISSAPTVTSTKFEFCIKRDTELFGSTLFPNSQIKIAMEDGSFGDFLPGQGNTIDYNAQVVDLDPLPNFSIDEPTNSDLRILTYNVEFDGFFETDNYAAYNRILNAINPDIIGFQEIYDYNSEEVADLVETMLPSETDENWYNAQAGNSDNHIVSRYPIIDQFIIQGNGTGASSTNGAFLVNLPTLEEHLLFVVAHTPCCANNEDRQLEIDAIMAFIRDAKNGIGPLTLADNSPIIIVGDMNLVGFNQQLTTFITGDIVNENLFGQDFAPDWNGENFVDARPYTTGVPANFTWYDEGSSFAPGRLDFNISTGSLLNLENSYSLFTPALDINNLETHNLQAGDTPSVSDHLPVVCDFSILDPNGVNDLSISELQFEIFPNPINNNFTISFNSEKASEITIEISDVLGNKTKFNHKGITRIGENNVSINIENYASGTYFVSIQLDQNLLTKKIIKE